MGSSPPRLWRRPRGRARGLPSVPPPLRGSALASGWPSRRIPVRPPAHAGRTRSARPRPSSRWAHPRASGGRVQVDQAGSRVTVHPRPWRTFGSDGGGSGTIPARARQTPLASSRGSRPLVHPRARGADVELQLVGGALDGTSPRARGRPPRRRLGCGSARYIPARTGGSAAWRSAICTARVHPRARGAQRSTHPRTKSAIGTSPRARGGARRRRGRGSGLRYIPGREARTSFWRRRPVRRASSLMRGGPLGAPPDPCTSPQVHPRVRGDVLHGRHEVPSVRVVPARAGRMRSLGGDHARGVPPRVSGADDVGLAGARFSCGTSPRPGGCWLFPAAAGVAYDLCGALSLVHPRF